MAQAKICCKVLLEGCRMKRKLDAIERAKKNAERERLGLEPIYPWYERVSMFIQDKWRYNIVAPICPGCVYGWSSSRVPRVCRTGTFQNEAARSLLAFVCAVVLSFVWFFIMWYQLDYSVQASMFTSSVLALGLGVGLAFNMTVRCVVLLMLPSLFSSKGRSLLLGYAFLLVMTHPVKNFTNNLNVMSESMTCGQQLAVNTTKSLAKAASGPASDMLEDIRTILQALVEFAERLREAFEAVRKLFAEVLGAIKRVKDWLGDMVNVCNDQMGAPYKRCIDAVNRGFEDCKAKIGIGHSIFKLCNIVYIANALCNIARIGELFCHITAAITNMIKDNVKTNLMLAVQKVEDMFWFDVELDYFYQVNLTQSRTTEQISEDIHNEIRQRMKPLRVFLTWTNFLMVFALFFLVIKSVMYRRKFLQKDQFDNYYLTAELAEISGRRKKLMKDAPLPLKGREKWKYVHPKSYILVQPEQWKLKKGLVFYLGTLMQSGFFLTLDCGLYWLLNVIKEHGHLQTNHNVPTHTKLHVQGSGILADIYRALITQFDPLKHPSVAIDTSPCLPQPSLPDWAVYRTVGSILGICLFLLLLEAYGLRLRHIIVGYFHPMRKKHRAVWLANHILRKRGTFVLHLRRQLRRAYKTKEDEDKASLLMVIAARFPCMNKVLRMLGIKYKSCLSCGLSGKPDDMNRFRHCENKGCKAVYCLKCFAELENICSVCMNPLDYADYSDISEERDSSDEEGGKPSIADYKAMNINTNCNQIYSQHSIHIKHSSNQNNCNLALDKHHIGGCLDKPQCHKRCSLTSDTLRAHNEQSLHCRRVETSYGECSCGKNYCPVYEKDRQLRHWAGKVPDLVSMDIFEMQGENGKNLIELEDGAKDTDEWLSDSDQEYETLLYPREQVIQRE